MLLILFTRADVLASPPSTRHFRGSSSRELDAASNADKCVGVTFKQSTGWLAKYSPSTAGEIDSSSDTRRHEPPLHSAGNTAVLPGSVAVVDKLAKVERGGRLRLAMIAFAEWANCRCSIATPFGRPVEPEVN